MADGDAQGASSELEEQAFLEAVTQTLLAIANARFDVRAPRSYRGDRRDVLAFLANSTADEVESLVSELRREREELQRAQTRLIQSEKLSALGRLAAGVAHEMNQPLTVLRTLIDLMRTDPQASLAERVDELELMSEAATHMGRIVDSIRTFASPRPIEMTSIPAEEPFIDAHRLLASDLRQHGIEVVWSLPPELPPVRGDAARLRQVFINLLANARDALLAAEATEPQIELGIEVVEGGVRYLVRDNGPGVPAELAGHIFEPFFSTKDAVQGTGLGLSVAHGIAREHGGRLEMYEGDGGACFFVELPRKEVSEA